MQQTARRKNEIQCRKMKDDSAEDQVSTFFQCCLKLLINPKVREKLTAMLTKMLALSEMEEPIFAPLPERNLWKRVKTNALIR